jgi:hypothetical protein
LWTLDLRITLTERDSPSHIHVLMDLYGLVRMHLYVLGMEDGNQTLERWIA